MDESMLFWGLGLLAAALLLVVIEVFVPSGGVIAFVATGCAVAGVYCLFRYQVTWGIIGICCVVILGPLAFGFALRVWPSTPMGRKMMGAKTPEELETERQAEMSERERLAALVGAEGVVLTDLRPVGVVQVGSQRFDALAESSFIRAGAKVKVTVVESNQIKVRAVT